MVFSRILTPFHTDFSFVEAILKVIFSKKPFKIVPVSTAFSLGNERKSVRMNFILPKKVFSIEANLIYMQM